MKYVIEAIVCDPSPRKPLFGGDYYKIVFNSEEPNVDMHMEDLSRAGYRVLSVKSEPAVHKSDFITPDRQGNQSVVDGKPVHEDYNP